MFPICRYKRCEELLEETPLLVPYEQLSESEKDYDRNTAIQTLKLIVKLGHDITQKSK